MLHERRLHGELHGLQHGHAHLRRRHE
jgi:hypothetical protein